MTTATIDQAAVQRLMDRARREVDAGLLPSAQVALALNGQLVAFETFGDATNDTRYVVFSATKAFVAGAMWALIGDGLIDVAHTGGRRDPRVRRQRQGGITIEQVMLHTSGFPYAPLRPIDRRHQRGTMCGVRQVAAELGAGHRVRVPRDLGPLGAGRVDRTGHRQRLPRRRAPARHRTRRPGTRARPHRAPRRRTGGRGRARDARRARSGVRHARAAGGRGHHGVADGVQRPRRAARRRARWRWRDARRRSGACTTRRCCTTLARCGGPTSCTT